ncbi:MAG: YkgJ family cysteine cluster protein [Gammaproteobacteria bacterium]
MLTLSELYDEIDERVAIIRSSYSDWLCRRGCEGCCRRLAEIPQLTADEWALLREGLALLPGELLLAVRRNIAALAEQQTRPIVCPLLDRSAGTCLVYLHRPTACRTYGFYVQRDKGLYCKDIQAQVDNRVLDDVVWGNQDAIEQKLKATGEIRELPLWLADWKIE